jgi:hypothetical protein
VRRTAQWFATVLQSQSKRAPLYPSIRKSSSVCGLLRVHKTTNRSSSLSELLTVLGPSLNTRRPLEMKGVKHRFSVTACFKLSGHYGYKGAGATLEARVAKMGAKSLAGYVLSSEANIAAAQ